MADKRFEQTYTQGVISTVQIWVDKETGVNYLYMTNGETGGLTPLLGRDGKPIITTVER